jgi:hypothetical protein
MSYQTVMVVDDDCALLRAVTGLMQFHLPDVRAQPFDVPSCLTAIPVGYDSGSDYLKSLSSRPTDNGLAAE